MFVVICILFKDINYCALVQENDNENSEMIYTNIELSEKQFKITY